MQCVPTSGFWRGVSRRTCSTARTLTQNCSQGIWEIRQHAQTRCHKAACRSEPQPGTNHPAVCRQSWVHGPGLAKMFHGAAAARPSTRDSQQVPMVALASSHAAPHCSDPEGWQTYTGWGQAQQAQQPWVCSCLGAPAAGQGCQQLPDTWGGPEAAQVQLHSSARACRRTPGGTAGLRRGTQRSRPMLGRLMPDSRPSRHP